MIGFRMRPDDADVSDAEIAYHLQLRNDVAAGGLSVLPTSP